MEERIQNWLKDKEKLEQSYEFYFDKELITEVEDENNRLQKAHLEKAEHNLEFSYFLLNQNEEYLDWSIIGLYYAVYHSSLSLMIKCGHFSKNHNATLCFLIRNFSEFGEEDIELFEDLELKEEEIKFYTSVKNERQKASYSTKISFEKEDIEDLRLRTIEFITKIRLLIDNLNSENETL